MPEEANLCLNCMNECKNDNLVEIKNTKRHVQLRDYLIKLKPRNFLNSFKSLSKKNKIKACAMALCFSLVVFFIGYLLSPADEPLVSGINSTQGYSNSADDESDKNISHAEKIINKILGKEETENPSSREQAKKSGETDSKKGTNNVSAKGVNNKENSTDSSKSNQNNKPTGNSSSGGSSSGSNSNSSSSSGNNSLQNSENSSSSNSTPVLNLSDWEYKISDGEINITKYTGNDKHVMVPDQIESKNVTSIAENTFLNNSYIETVTFKDSEKYHELWINSNAFKNCSSLKKISFPENTDLGFFSEFAVNCPKLNDIYINHWQGKFVDGAFYWKANGRTWQLINYCEGCTNDTLNVPEWVSSVNLASGNLSNCKYLKEINLPQGCTPPVSQGTTYNYKYLESINIDGDDGSQYYFTYDGILFSRSGVGNYKLNMNIYPGSKKDKSFTFPEYCRIDFNTSNVELNLETICIPSTSDIDDITLKDIKHYLKNLKTVKLEKGHSNISKYKSYIAWECNVVEY